MFNRLFKSENNYKAIYTPGYRYTEYGDHDNNYTTLHYILEHQKLSHIFRVAANK